MPNYHRRHGIFGNPLSEGWETRPGLVAQVSAAFLIFISVVRGKPSWWVNPIGRKTSLISHWKSGVRIRSPAFSNRPGLYRTWVTKIYYSDFRYSPAKETVLPRLWPQRLYETRGGARELSI